MGTKWQNPHISCTFNFIASFDFNEDKKKKCKQKYDTLRTHWHSRQRGSGFALRPDGHPALELPWGRLLRALWAAHGWGPLCCTPFGNAPCRWDACHPTGSAGGTVFYLCGAFQSSLSGYHDYQQPVSIEYVFLAHILSQTVLKSHFKSWENPSSNFWELWKQKGRPVTWLIWIISQGHRVTEFPGDQSVLSMEKAFPPGAPCSPAAPSGLHVPEIRGLLGGDRSCLGGCHGV